MARFSNVLIAILNVLTMLIAVASLASGIYFNFNGGTHCQKFLQMPLLVVGAFLFVVSLCGLVGSTCKVSFLLWIYLFVMFLMILGLLCFTILALVVTNKGVGQVISNRGYKEYRLGDYSNWLQNHLVNDKNWGRIKSCLMDTDICSRLGKEINDDAAAFYQKNLSPIQSGCCKPPTYCGFEFKNATFWVVPKTGPAVADTDCKTWSNDQKQLCFDCKSCRAGLLANIKSQWRTLAICNGCIFVVLIFIYSVGCCAFRNNRRDKYKYQRGFP
ncbi:hypothetical protein AAG906_001470 [Vitis piasezkii]